MKRPAHVVFAFALGAFAAGGACSGTVGHHGGNSGTGGGTNPNDPNIIGNPMQGSLCTPGNAPPTTRFFRLTHAQYDNAVRALTGLDVRPAADFPADQNQAGFDRGMDLQVGDALGKAYRATAEALAAQVVATAAAYQKVVGCDPASGDACARTFIAEFGKRVYRRPLTEDEQSRYFTLFGMADMLVEGTTSTPFQKGVQTIVEALLQSPFFLYRSEMTTQQSNGLIPLGGYEIASRLAFFLQNGPPDDTLLAAAAAGALDTADGIAAEAQRLIATPAGRLTVRDFHRQWLVMDDAFANKLAKDTTRYPSVTPNLAPTLIEETQRFVETVSFDIGKGFTTLMTAPFTFVNRTTAPLYGVTGSFTDTLTRVDLPAAQRAGLFTQVGFLASHAYSNQSSPIHRGAFIQKSVLCKKIPDPPPDIPELPPLMATQTTRDQVTMHTAPAACMGCHALLINPVGYAFENFDAAGQWRTTENGVAIDATGTLAGTKQNAAFTDAVSASAAIAASMEGRSCYATQWVRYAFGRAEATGDSCAIEALATKMASDDYKITDLLVDMTRSKAFMFRTPGEN
jgi:hypothetical protein